MRIAIWHNLPSGGGKRALYYHVWRLVERGRSVEAWCPPSADRTYPPLGALIREHITPIDLRPSSRWPLWSRLLDPAADDHQRRLTGIVHSVVSGLECLVIGIVVSFISVPLTIGYPHPGLYGVWVTIGALLAWLQLADFGLGNGLSNALATAYGNHRLDLARRYVSTSLAMLTGVTLLIGGAYALAWP